MKVLVFDLMGAFAYFKSPEGSRSNYSFPFPTRTAVIGMIAAIMGEARNSYWNSKQYRELSIGIQVLTEPKIMGIKMNYWRSKTTTSLGTNQGKFILPGSDAKNRGYTTQVKFEYLQDVAFRIYVRGEIVQELASRIRERRYAYPPYLGHANLLAEIEFIGEFEYTEISNGNFVSVIPNSALDTEHPLSKIFEVGIFEMYPGVPSSYTAVEQTEIEGKKYYMSVPDRFETIIVPKGEISASVLPQNGLRIEIGDETVEVVVA